MKTLSSFSLTQKVGLGLGLILTIVTFYFYASGYNTSLDWEITTESELEDVTTLTFEKGPFSINIDGERVVLTESYIGNPIDLLPGHIQVFTLIIWIGFMGILAWASFLRRYAYLTVGALFIFFLARLGIHDLIDWNVNLLLLPIIWPVILGFTFQAFYSNVSYALRLTTLFLLSWPVFYLLPVDATTFSLFFLGQGMQGLAIILFIWLLVIGEELLVGLVWMITQTRGAKGNHQHFLILSGLYLVNLIGRYLETHGIINFSFSFFDPIVLASLSFLMAFWTLRLKNPLWGSDASRMQPVWLLLSLGLIAYSVLSLSFAKGLDALPYAFNYLALYTHLAMGAMFFFYVVLNFLSPMASGLQVFKILYEPQSFHYVTVRIGGFIAILALYFSTGGSIRTHFNSAGFNLLGDQQLVSDEQGLARTYYKEAADLAYHTHYPNYQLASIYWAKGNTLDAQFAFDAASDRHPSAQSHANTALLQQVLDENRARVQLQEGLLTNGPSDQLSNNLALIYLAQGKNTEALSLFRSNEDTPGSVNFWSFAKEVSASEATAAYFNSDIHTATNVLGRFVQELDSVSYRSDLTDVPVFSKEAYWMNAANVLLDTNLQADIDTHLIRTPEKVFPGLKRALARNLFISGNTKRAMQLYTQLISGAPPFERANLQFELGKLLLFTDAPEHALTYLNAPEVKAIDGTEVYRAVSLILMGQLPQANQELKGSALQLDDLNQLWSPLPLEDEKTRWIWLYAHWQQLSSEAIAVEVNRLSEREKGQVVNKIQADIQNGYRFNKWADFDDLFTKLGLPEWRSVPVTDPMSAGLNPFNELVILSHWKALHDQDPVDSYNFVIDALQYNPYPISLLMAAAENAAELNLMDYAEPYLERLKRKLPTTDYDAFKLELDQTVAELNREDWYEQLPE